MTLLAVERIKLFSTRSPWWCMATAGLLSVGFAMLIVGLMPEVSDLHVGFTQAFYQLSLMVILVMAVVAVTSEYRFGTLKATFTAVPNRTAALLAKTAVVAMVTGLVGLAIAFASYGAAVLIRPAADLSLSTGAEWRAVAGVGLVYGFGAIVAVALGILVRQTAGAVAGLLIWILLLEFFGLLRLIPRVGDDITSWLPFTAANHFVTAGIWEEGFEMPLGPWGSLAYFAGIAVALLVVALMVAERRDA